MKKVAFCLISIFYITFNVYAEKELLEEVEPGNYGKEEKDLKGKTEPEKQKEPEALKKQKAEEKRAKFLESIVNSFKFGTDDEIGMNLNHVKHFELDSEIQMMSPHLGKLLESDRTDTLIKTTLQTVVKLKLKEHAPLFVKHIKSKNKVLVKEAIISLQEFEYAKAEPEVFNIFQEQKLALNNPAVISIIQTLADFKSKKLGEYIYRSLLHKYPEIANTLSNTDKLSIPENTKESKELWGKKLENEIESQFYLALGKMEYKKSILFLRTLLQSAMKTDDSELEIDGELPEVSLALSKQSYIMNALGKMNDQKSGDLALKKIERVKKYEKDKKRSHFNLYMQSILTLSRLGHKKSNSIIVAALKDNSSVVRYEAAKMLQSLRLKGALEMVTYRSLKDSSPKVRFECLKVLLETAEPGLTTKGKIKGDKPSAAATTEAFKSLEHYMNYEKNKVVVYPWLHYIAKNSNSLAIERLVIKRLETKAGRFFKGNYVSKIEQKKIADTIAAFAITKAKKKVNLASIPSFIMLQKMGSDHYKKMEYSYRSAKKSLNIIDKINSKKDNKTKKDS